MRKRIIDYCLKKGNTLIDIDKEESKKWFDLAEYDIEDMEYLVTRYIEDGSNWNVDELINAAAELIMKAKENNAVTIQVEDAIEVYKENFPNEPNYDQLYNFLSMIQAEAAGNYLRHNINELYGIVKGDYDPLFRYVEFPKPV